MRCTALFRPSVCAIGLGLSIVLTLASLGCEPQEKGSKGDSGSVAVDPDATATETETATSTADAPGEATVTTADRAAFDKVIGGLQGKVVLVDYWATWCTPCVEQFPHTVAKANELADRGFAAVSVSFDDPGDQETILDALRDLKAERVTNLVSAHGGAPESYEAFELKGGPPWYQLYDRKGELKYVFCDVPETGVEALPVDQIDAKIEELLAEPQE